MKMTGYLIWIGVLAFDGWHGASTMLAKMISRGGKISESQKPMWLYGHDSMTLPLFWRNEKRVMDLVFICSKRPTA